MAYDETKPITGGSLVAVDIRENFRALKDDRIVNPIFRGCLVKKTTTQIIVATWESIQWNTEDYDTDNLHDNVTDNTRITVPSGVTKMKFICALEITNIAAICSFSSFFLKNGVTEIPGQQNRLQAGWTGYVSYSSPVLIVTPGDYFTCRAYSEESVTIMTTSTFAAEIIG